MKLLLKIKYDGADFCGYQAQPSKRTVQGTLNEAAYQLTGKQCNITGCSRTDSGVHALSFYCTVCPTDNSEISIPLANIPTAFNKLLPSDIAVAGAYYVPDDFHPRYDVKSKEYTYLFYNSAQKDPFMSDRALHLKKRLDSTAIDRMNEAARLLCATQDFRSFMAANSKITDTVRTIYSAEFYFDEDIIKFKIKGNGFLYNMVRIIVGTLLDVGYNKIQPADIKRIIDSKDRKNAGQTVSPAGLYLSSVEYDKSLNIN